MWHARRIELTIGKGARCDNPLAARHSSPSQIHASRTRTRERWCGITACDAGSAGLPAAGVSHIDAVAQGTRSWVGLLVSKACAHP